MFHSLPKELRLLIIKFTNTGILAEYLLGELAQPVPEHTFRHILARCFQHDSCDLAVSLPIPRSIVLSFELYFVSSETMRKVTSRYLREVDCYTAVDLARRRIDRPALVQLKKLVQRLDTAVVRREWYLLGIEIFDRIFNEYSGLERAKGDTEFAVDLLTCAVGLNLVKPVQELVKCLPQGGCPGLRSWGNWDS
eukprot:jgi/Hompol1/117/HPOL_005234-RA